MIKLLAFLCLGSALVATAADDYSYLDALLAQDDPPVLQYSSPNWGHPDLQAAAGRDYARMGFNGVQHGYSLSDRLPYGTFLSVHCTAPPPVRMNLRRADGTVYYKWIHFGDIYAPENIEFVADYIINIFREQGEENFAKLNGRFVAMTADEADLQYAHALTAMVSPAREAAWRRWLAARYGDETPAADSNGDGRCYAADAVGDALATWDEVPIPDFEQRFAEPLIWIGFRQFICDNLYGFVQAVEERINAKGIPFAWGFSGHASISWPGGSAQSGGADYYLQATRGGLLAVENTNARWPWQMDMNYVVYDRMSRQYHLPVFGWSWFWPNVDEAYNWGSYDSTAINRIFAQMYAHELHGLLYWNYVQTYDRLRPQYQRIAFWHHWYRRHWNFLKQTHPIVPEVAVLHPKTTTLFYSAYLYPKQDYGWTLQALHDLQVPFTILTEEEIARDGVGDYRALLVLSAARVPRPVAAAIETYLDRGGHVYADADSLAMDATGQPLDVLPRRFGVILARKQKVRFHPSMQSAAEAAWAKDPANPLPTTTTYGIPQSEVPGGPPSQIDMRIPWPVPTLATWHDVLTARADAGVLATHADEPIAVETPQTMWLGFRLGADLCATYPVERFRATGEPMDDAWNIQYRSAVARSPYVDLLGRFLDRAGVTPKVHVTRDGKLARNIDVYTRVHEADGSVLAILVETDLEVTGALDRYHLHCPLAKDGFVPWDLTTNTALNWAEPGVVEVRVPEHDVAYILMAPPAVVASQAAVQTELLALDLTPQPLPLGPRGGPDEGPAPRPRVTATEKGAVPADAVVRLQVRIHNPLTEARVAEPVVIPGSLLTGLFPAGTVRGARLADGEGQWDDLDGDGVLSPADEIAWQQDLDPDATVVRALDLLPVAAAPPPNADFVVDATDGAALNVRLGQRQIFRLNAKGEWQLPGRLLPAPGFVFGLGTILDQQDRKMAWQATEVLTDGPIRKRFRVRWACDDPAVVSDTTYTVYAQQPADSALAYAHTVHDVLTGLDFGPVELTAAEVEADRGAARNNRAVVNAVNNWGRQITYCHNAGALLQLPVRGTKLHYVDAVGRLCEGGGVQLFVNNCGGWVAREFNTGEGSVQVALRRLRNVLSGPLLRDETDGVQVPVWSDAALVRAAYSYAQSDDELFDSVIPAGTRWTLDSLVAIDKVYDEAVCRRRRAHFATGLDIAITVVWEDR